MKDVHVKGAYFYGRGKVFAKKKDCRKAVQDYKQACRLKYVNACKAKCP